MEALSSHHNTPKKEEGQEYQANLGYRETLSQEKGGEGAVALSSHWAHST